MVESLNSKLMKLFPELKDVKEDRPVFQHYKIADPVIYNEGDQYKMEWRANFNRINNNIEGALVHELIKIAEEMGITDLYLINEDRVKEIFKKTVPMKTIDCTREFGDGLLRCPACGDVVNFADRFCRYCGQAIKSSIDDEEGDERQNG